MSTPNRSFPAEWEKQEGVLLCFPNNGNDWPFFRDRRIDAFGAITKRAID